MRTSKISFQRNLSWIVTGCFALFSVLSWILLFRDKRALLAISYFYPQAAYALTVVRNYLLHHGLNTVPTALFALVALLAFYCYIKSMFSQISLKSTIIFALLFQCITFISYPILSTDIFSYVMTSRVATVHNQNIWQVPPDHFSSDPFLKLSDWKTVAGVYGGVDEVLYNGASFVAGNNLVFNIFFFKLLPWIFLLLTMGIVYKILHEFYPEKLSVGFRFIFWNPLLILEIMGSGHNDILMLFFALVAFYFFLKKNYIWAGIALALSVQIKLITGLFFVFLVGSLLVKREVKNALQLLVPFVTINIVVFMVFMQVNPLSYFKRVVYNTGIYWQSLPTLLSRFHIQTYSMFSLLFIITLFVLFIRQMRKRENPLTLYCIAMLIYLLFVASAYWNWYVLWVLVFLPFIPSNRLKAVGVIFSFTSLLAYPFYWISLRYNYQNILWTVIIYLFVFGIPIATYLFYNRSKLVAEKLLRLK